MRQYSADRVKVSFFGLDLTPGLASGTFIQATRNADAWSQKPNGVGGVVHMFNPDKSGELSLQIDGESRTHQELITFHNADLISRSLAGPLLVRDTSTKEIAFFNKARIKTLPNLQKGTQSTIYSWIFIFELEVRQSFGFENNAIGS